MTKTTPEGRRHLKSRTKLVHAGRHPFEQYGFINTPIYRGSTVLFPTYADLVRRNARYPYGTVGTPTTEALETAWTEFAGAAGTVLAPSGLAAITLALADGCGRGRSYPRHRLRLSADPQFLRYGSEPAWDYDHAITIR